MPDCHIKMKIMKEQQFLPETLSTGIGVSYSQAANKLLRDLFPLAKQKQTGHLTVSHHLLDTKQNKTAKGVVSLIFTNIHSFNIYIHNI